MGVASILEKKGSEVATLDPQQSLGDAANLLAQKKIGAVVITKDEGAVCGILSERDIVRAIAAKGADALSSSIADHMTPDVMTCAETETTAQLMARMSAGRFRHLPVVQDGKLAGIVSIGDVVQERIADAEKEAEQMRAYITAI